MSKNSKTSYKQLQAQLQAEVEWFEGADLDIDEALAHYEKAGELIAQMQLYLSDIKNGLIKSGAKRNKD